MKKFALLLACLLLPALIGGCSSQGTSANYPANFKVTAGDASIVATWDAEEGVDYWLFYGLGANITTDNWATSGGRVATKVKPPHVLTGLTNGSTYSFTINGRRDGGPGGPGAPTQVATPRLSGASWTAGTPLGTAKLTGAAVGYLVGALTRAVVGVGGGIYSNSGLLNSDYTQATNPAAPKDLNAAVYASGGMLAVGAGGTALTSTDAITWTAQTTGYTNDLFGAATAGFGYLVVGSDGIILTSTSGATWTAQASTTANPLYAAVYGNSLYVVVGAAGTIVTSADAGTWTLSAPATSANLRGVTYASYTNPAGEAVSQWVAVGDAGTILTSTDGKAWTARTPFTTANLSAVLYAGQFVTVGSGGAIYTSTDAATWVQRSSTTTADLTAIARTLTGYIVTGDRGTILTSN